MARGSEKIRIKTQRSFKMTDGPGDGDVRPVTARVNPNAACFYVVPQGRFGGPHNPAPAPPALDAMTMAAGGGGYRNRKDK